MKASRSFNCQIRYFIGLIVLLLSQGLFFAHPTHAANGINRTFNYQARLLTSAGASVSDGAYSIKFSLYDSASGGTRIYTASGTTAVPIALSVTVTSGLFSILLGDTTSQGQNALNIDWNSDSIYIGVTVSSDAEMTPRKRLSAVPYAFNSETLQGNYASSSVTSTGGNLMSLHQTATDAASSARTALFVQTDGTSNTNDFLFKGNNGTADVFTISRQGYTTTTSIAWTSASGSSLLVGGQGVCLANGLNCPVGARIWIENATNNTISLTTTTRDVLLGGTTTGTSGFIFDFGERGTSTVLIGGATNTNLFVGTSTYGGGLNSQFVLNGNDVLVQGQLGSIDGLFSATGVTVGTGSTVYADGNLYKTNAGDFTLSLNNIASNWRFFTSSTERLTVASSGNIGIGVTTPLDALDVSGNVRNILRTGQTFSVAGSVNTSSSRSVFVSGKYAYVASDLSPGGLQIVDVTNPQAPVIVGTYTQTTVGPFDVYVAGRYAYLANTTAASFTIVDVSNPSAPVAVGSSTRAGSDFRSVFVSGRYAYLVDTNLNLLWIFDISNPTLPTVVATTTGAIGTNSIYVQGKYAYTVGDGTPVGLNFNVIDISNPAVPTVATSVNSAVQSDGIFVSGRYAYITEYTNDRLLIYDIANPTAPSLVSTVSLSSGSDPQSVIVSGRYAYIGRDGDSKVSIVDVSVPSSPAIMATVSSTGANPHVGAVAGRYAYITDFAASSNKLYILDVKGLETNGLIAHSAELGSLQVLTSGQVAQDFTVGSGLTVGTGGIYSQGLLSVFASTTSATTTWFLNNASGTAPVLQVTSGCDTTSSTNALLLLAGTKTDQRRFSVNCMGTVSSKGTFNTGGADFAEYFHVRDSSLGEGDAVVTDASSTGSIERSSSSTRRRTIGVIASNSGFIGNASTEKTHDPNFKIVALLGQVKTKVSAVQGSISPGDDLMVWEDGTLVKAHGAGMVLGGALESLETGTGTRLVYVNPHWWAGDILYYASNEHRMGNDLVVVSSTVASLSIPLVDSPSFTFRGSAWNASQGMVISSSFHLWNDVLSGTSSLFTLGGTSGTSLLTISDLGDASFFGDLSIGRRLFLGSRRFGETSKDTYLFVDDTLAPTSTYIATNADGWQTSSTYDYAERYESSQELIPGDLVIVDSTGMNRVKRSGSSSDLVLGIVSTRPGFVTGRHLTGTYPIALAGRVPTRVSTRNGSITAGDHLMASPIPGVAMKALGAGNTIGIALEPYTSSGEGRISVFVKMGWQGEKLITDGPIGSRRSGFAKIYAGSRSVNVSFPSLHAYPIVQITPYGEPKGGVWMTKVSDTGFEIVVGEAPQFDLQFAWTAESSVNGNRMHFSDNTTLPYDPLSGISYGPPAPLKQPTTIQHTSVTSTSTATSTPPRESSTATFSVTTTHP